MITRQGCRLATRLSMCHKSGIRVVGIVDKGRSLRPSTYFPFLDENSFRVMRSTKDEAADVWSFPCRRPRPCCSRGVGPHVRDQDRSMTSGLENDKLITPLFCFHFHWIVLFTPDGRRK